MHSTSLSVIQQTVLEAIASGATKTAAASQSGIHRDTINHWEHTVPGFREALLAAQAAYREELSSQLRRVSAKAIHRLEALLDDPATPAAVLFRAIQFTLTRPSFPQKEWALPENLNPPEIQQMQQSMAIIEGDYLAARQHDAIRKHAAPAGNARNVGNVGPASSAGTHFPPSRHVPIGFSNPDTIHSQPPPPNLPEAPQAADMPEASDVPGASDLPVASETSDPAPTPATRKQPARNAACTCGSRKKYKRCCGSGAPPQLHHSHAA